MFLAIREIRRAAVRFGLLVAAIGLLVFLILFQQALRDGLITSFVGGLRNQTAPVLVYSVDAQRVLQGSVISSELAAQVNDVEGVGKTAQVGQGTFSAMIGGDQEIDVAVLGTDHEELFRPERLSSGEYPSRPQEAVGSANDFSVGQQVEIVARPGGEPFTIKVVGLADDIQLNVTPTLFTDFDTYQAANQTVNPEAPEAPPNALALEPAAGFTATEVVAAINAAVGDAEALTRADAANKSPGVSQVRQSFQIIFLLYGLVVPLVTGLFFLIVTLQKAPSLTLLRAIGAPTAVLARSMLVQVALVIALGLVVGVALYLPLSQAHVGGLALRFDPETVLLWSVIMMVLGLFSTGASLLRVLRIDPMDATVGAGVR